MNCVKNGQPNWVKATRLRCAAQHYTGRTKWPDRRRKRRRSFCNVVAEYSPSTCALDFTGAGTNPPGLGIPTERAPIPHTSGAGRLRSEMPAQGARTAPKGADKALPAMRATSSRVLAASHGGAAGGVQLLGVLPHSWRPDRAPDVRASFGGKDGTRHIMKRSWPIRHRHDRSTGRCGPGMVLAQPNGKGPL